jgi:hypothetical protein
MTRCVRSDGSAYGTAGQCRKGVESEKEWEERLSKKYPEHAKGFKDLSAKIASLPDKEREVFNEAISIQLSGEGITKSSGKEKGRPLTEKEASAAVGKQINGWQRLAESGMPKTLLMRNGSTEEVPEGLVPVPEVKQSSGQAGFRLMDQYGQGLKYSVRPKQPGVYAQNRAAKGDTTRVLKDMKSFRESQTKTGGKWPTQSLPKRDGVELDPDKILSTLTPSQIKNIGGVGLSRNERTPGDPGYRIWTAIKNDPEALRERARAALQRWAEQGGRSGVSGLPVAPPGMKPRAGEEKSTIDHFNPISGGKSMSTADIRKQFDNFNNFLITEEGPNTQRSNTDWGDWLDTK